MTKLKLGLQQKPEGFEHRITPDAIRRDQRTNPTPTLQGLNNIAAINFLLHFHFVIISLFSILLMTYYYHKNY